MTDNHNSGASAGGIGLVTVLLALIFLFVWPGPLRWEYSSGVPRTKIDRISGKTFVLTGEGWRKVATNIQEDLPLAAYSDITTQEEDTSIIPTLDPQEFAIVVHNNSSWAVTAVKVEVRRGKATRQLVLQPEETIQPATSGIVKTEEVPDDLTLSPNEGIRDFKSKIIGAKGYPVD